MFAVRSRKIPVDWNKCISIIENTSGVGGAVFNVETESSFVTAEELLKIETMTGEEFSLLMKQLDLEKDVRSRKTLVDWNMWMKWWINEKNRWIKIKTMKNKY